MPLYDYYCDSCQTAFEAQRKIADREEADCPICQAIAKKTVSIPHVMLDGTDPAFPGEYAKWEKKRKQKLAQERKLTEN